MMVLALLDDAIATRLVLSSRLAAVGCELAALADPGAFRARLEAQAFDWLILDEAAVGPRGRRLLAHVARHRRAAGIAWLGAPPRRAPVPIDVAFTKPLRYGEIARFFAEAPSNLARALHPECRGGDPW